MIIAYCSGLQPTVVEIFGHITFKVKNQQQLQSLYMSQGPLFRE